MNSRDQGNNLLERWQAARDKLSAGRRRLADGIFEHLGFLAFVGGFLMTLWNLRIVWGGQRHWPARVWSVLLVLAAAIVLYIAFAFHLISRGVNY